MPEVVVPEVIVEFYDVGFHNQIGSSVSFRGGVPVPNKGEPISLGSEEFKVYDRKFPVFKDDLIVVHLSLANSNNELIFGRSKKTSDPDFGD